MNNSFHKEFIKYALSLLIIFYSFSVQSQDSTKFSFLIAFHHLGKNTLGSFTYNYGANYLAAGLLTYPLVKSGFDWKWERMSVNHSWIPAAGMPSVALGGLVPLAVPLGKKSSKCP